MGTVATKPDVEEGDVVCECVDPWTDSKAANLEHGFQGGKNVVRPLIVLVPTWTKSETQF